MFDPPIRLTGGQLIADTAEHDGPFRRLQFLDASVIATAPGNVSGLAGASIPAGTVLDGTFDSVTLTSGRAVAYAA